MTAIPTDAAAPFSLPDGAALPDRLAPLGDRLAAAVVDFIVAVVAFFAIGALAVGGLASFVDHVQTGSELDKLKLNLGSWMLYPLVHGWLLKQRGQTIGKWLLGIRIVRTDGLPASLARLLLLRWLPICLVGLVPYGAWIPLIDALLALRASRRCLHDLLADTVVVTTPGVPPLR